MNIRKEDYELNQNEDVERIIFNRDKFLLEMSMHVYDESEKTFENLDLKISTMIASLGTLMTIQGSIFIYLLTEFIRNNSIYINISLVIVMLISLLSYTYSMKKFIEAYFFRGYETVPNPEELLNYAKENIDEHFIVSELLATFKESTLINVESNQNKVKTSKIGFKYFKIGGISTIGFIIYYVILILF